MKQAIFTKSLTISMPPGQYEQIKQITDEQCISMAEWTREAVEKALSNSPEKGESNNDE